ncbi:hypothetical protein BpHYR1_039900 [Brachionus plicatilis]|uniref:Uncharacterized protein n=1 Tax=Brachionus plicatilis TaxID=10195 RepID=A0A3M7R1Z4_BRAPC|nr:hypothetical protein BpHYR1_039900 [Brachionus plicatilis]
MSESTSDLSKAQCKEFSTKKMVGMILIEWNRKFIQTAQFRLKEIEGNAKLVRKKKQFKLSRDKQINQQNELSTGKNLTYK